MATVAEAVGAALVRHGADTVFGVVGSGNFAVTNAMVAAGARFVAARHEGGAATMADAYARASGTPGVLSVHQGCGLTNALTGITEAAKSRTPLVVLAAEATSPLSNFAVDQAGLAAAVGAVPRRVSSAATALEDVAAAVATAVGERRTVLLNLPLDVQVDDVPHGATDPVVPAPALPAPAAADVDRLAAVLQTAARPVFVAGRGARHARAALEELADRCGALLATSAVARGLFAGNPWSLGTSGGFASPLAAELIREADLLVAWGCSLTMWTTRHGRLVGPGTRVAQVDLEPGAIGRNQPADTGVVGDVRRTAEAVGAVLGTTCPGYRSPELADRLAAGVRWRDVPFTPAAHADRIDPRTLTTALDDLLPEQRLVAVDSGNFMGYPSAFLDVPDADGSVFTQAFQSVGLGLATAIGAALARPDRLTVAALGDGGALMGASELETVVRLGLPLVVVVYDDAAYGAEVHHFGPDGHPLDTVRFPDADLAAVARGHGFEAHVVRAERDLEPVARWLAGPRSRPLLLDAKVAADEPSWWLAEAFGH
ncbi:thiamine pyrophosphate-binding protein [Geodermatophilus marinus]|uniref:thiamine pyrophosphate-binding protein n=1 Tax=Geodermatophilus sp. LHW52908 TaxID=2303986 RepID=UPI000E3D5C61|nr:thiamine pyrophosphate-binding protein [Geodermatophilus sp. LHW52908]RFU21556.1 thiamine pyrophosphate-binding protein [Geodermatophilus sp. LHW52908]